MTERSCPEVLDDPLLTVTVAVSHPARVTVRAVGDIDLLSRPDFAEALIEGVDAVGMWAGGSSADDPPLSRTVMCDLDGVTFCGASAVSALVETAEHARVRGVLLVVVATRGPVRRALTLAGLVDAAGASRVMTCPSPRRRT